MGAIIERQANGHLPAMENHLTAWATLESSDLGLILQALKPANDALVEVGGQVLGKMQEIYAQGADNLKGVINSYADAERRTHEILQRLGGLFWWLF